MAAQWTMPSPNWSAILSKLDIILMFRVLHRSDLDQWQYIAGGDEDDETPVEVTKRKSLRKAS